MADVKAVIFDLDGVITDTAEHHFLAWKNLAESLGIPFDKEFNEELKGVSRMESLERILAKGNQQEKFSEEEKVALATKKNEEYKELIKTITPQNILPGIKLLLDELRNKKIKIGLASASKNALSVLSSLGLREYFDEIVDVSTLKNGKPHPEIFLKAAELLDVPVESCIGVEDAEAGIESIKAADMFAVGVGTKEAMRRADVFVEHTNQLTLAYISTKFKGYVCS